MTKKERLKNEEDYVDCILPEAMPDCVCKITVHRQFFGREVDREICGAEKDGCPECPKHCPNYMSPEDTAKLLEEIRNAPPFPESSEFREDDIPFDFARQLL